MEEGQFSDSSQELSIPCGQQQVSEDQRYSYLKDIAGYQPPRSPSPQMNCRPYVPTTPKRSQQQYIDDCASIHSARQQEPAPSPSREQQRGKTNVQKTTQQPDEDVEPPSPDPCSIIYFAPRDAIAVEHRDSFFIDWRSRWRGEFIRVETESLLAFRLKHRRQATDHALFISHCATSASDIIEISNRNEFYHWSRPIFSNDFKNISGIRCDPDRPRLYGESPLPFTKECMDTIETILSSKPSEETLRKDLASSEVDKIAKALSSNKKRTINNPVTEFNWKNDPLCEFLSTNPPSDISDVSNIGLASLYLNLPSNKTRARNLVAKQEASYHLSQMISFHTSIQALVTLRQNIKHALSQEDKHYLEGIQHFLNHSLQAEKFYLKKDLIEATKTHLLMRHEACSIQHNESIREAFLFSAINGPCLINVDSTAEVMKDPLVNRALVIKPQTKKKAISSQSGTYKAQPVQNQLPERRQSYPAAKYLPTKPGQSSRIVTEQPSTSKFRSERFPSRNYSYKYRTHYSDKRATTSRSYESNDPAARKKTRPAPPFRKHK